MQGHAPVPTHSAWLQWPAFAAWALAETCDKNAKGNLIKKLKTLRWGHSHLPPTKKDVPSVACYIVINNPIERHCGNQDTSCSNSRGCSFSPLSSTSNNSSFLPPPASPAFLGSHGQGSAGLVPASCLSPLTQERGPWHRPLCVPPARKGSQSPSVGSVRTCRTTQKSPWASKEKPDVSLPSLITLGIHPLPPHSGNNFILGAVIT